MRRKHILLLLVTAVTFQTANAAPLASKFDENEASSPSFLSESASLQIEPSSSFMDMQSSVLFSNRFVSDDVDGSHLSSFLNEVYLEPTSSSHFQDGYSARPSDILQPLVAQLAESMLSDLNYRIDSSILTEASSSLNTVSKLAESSSEIPVLDAIDDNYSLKLTPQFYSSAFLVSKTPDVSEGLLSSSPILIDGTKSSNYQLQQSFNPNLHSIRYSAEASTTPELPEESHLSFQTIASALLLDNVASVYSVKQQDDPSIIEDSHLTKSSSTAPNLVSSSVKTLGGLPSTSQTPELPEVSDIPFEVVASGLLYKGTSVNQLADLSSTKLHHANKLSGSVPNLHSSSLKTLQKSPSSSRTPQLPKISSLLLKSTSAAQFDELLSTNLHPSLTKTFRPSALRITPSPKPFSVSSASLLKVSDAAIASSFFNAILSSISTPVAFEASSPSPLFTSLNEPISSIVTQFRPEVSSDVVIPQLQSLLYSANLLRSSIIKNTPAFSSLIQPTPSLLPNYSPSSLAAETDRITNVIEINNLPTESPNNSAATVDKIIEGLMNIIRPLNSHSHHHSTLLPSIPTIPEIRPSSADNDQEGFTLPSSSQLLQSLHKFYLTPSVDHRTSSKSSIKPQIFPSSTPFAAHSSTEFSWSLSSRIPPLDDPNGIPSSDQFDISVIHSILHQQDNGATTEVVENDIGTQGQRPEFSHFDKPEVVTFNALPSAIIPLSTQSFSQTKPDIVTPIFNTRSPWKRPSSTRSTVRTTPRRTTTRKATTTTTTTTTTTKRPTVLAFGEAKPIVLDLFDNDSPEVVNSRLPSTGSSSLAEEQLTGHIEATIGSNILKIKEKIPTLRPPTRKPSLQFISSQFNFDDLVSSTSVPPSRPVVRPSHQGSAPATNPLRVTTPSIDADQPVEMDHANNQHNVISSQATFFIRPTSASSSVVRQTIFQTVVSISDSTDEFAHFHDEEPIDFPSQNVLATPPSLPSSPSVGQVEHNHDDSSAAASDTPATLTNVPPTTKTTPIPTTTTTKRTTTTTTTTTTTKAATTTSKKPTTTRRPALSRPRSTTRRPIRRTTTKKPIADAPTITVTRRPFRPGQMLMNFGYTLIPAAVIATIIGLPLVVAGKRKRDVSAEADFMEKLMNIKKFIEEMTDPENTLKRKAFRRRSLRNLKSKWR